MDLEGHLGSERTEGRRLDRGGGQADLLPPGWAGVPPPAHRVSHTISPLWDLERMGWGNGLGRGLRKQGCRTGQAPAKGSPLRCTFPEKEDPGGQLLLSTRQSSQPPHQIPKSSHGSAPGAGRDCPWTGLASLRVSASLVRGGVDILTLRCLGSLRPQEHVLLGTRAAERGPWSPSPLDSRARALASHPGRPRAPRSAVGPATYPKVSLEQRARHRGESGGAEERRAAGGTAWGGLTATARCPAGLTSAFHTRAGKPPPGPKPLPIAIAAVCALRSALPAQDLGGTRGAHPARGCSQRRDPGPFKAPQRQATINISARS